MLRRLINPTAFRSPFKRITGLFQKQKPLPQPQPQPQSQPQSQSQSQLNQAQPQQQFGTKTNWYGCVSLLALGIIDIFYLLKVVPPPQKEAVFYFLDRHYYRPYETIRQFYETKLIHIFNPFIPFGITTSHIRSMEINPVDHISTVWKDDGYTKQGMIKYIHFMSKISNRDDLMDYAIYQSDFLQKIFQNLKKLDYSYSNESYRNNHANFDPLFNLLQNILTPERSKELLKVPNLTSLLALNAWNQPGIVGLVLFKIQQLSDDESVRSSDTYRKLMNLKQSNKSIIQWTPDELTDTPPTIVPLLPAVSAFTFPCYFFSHYHSLILKQRISRSLLSTITNLSLYSGFHCFLYLINFHLANEIAESEYWKYTREATAAMHGMLIGSCIVASRKSKYLAFPIIASLLLHDFEEQVPYLRLPDKYLDLKMDG